VLFECLEQRRVVEAMNGNDALGGMDGSDFLGNLANAR
jgi:hypothetical protein